MRHYVYLSKRGVEELVFTGSKEEANEYWESLHKECRRIDPTGGEMDAFIRSDEEQINLVAIAERWSRLSEADKHDIIEVNGRKYVRKIYEEVNGGK